MHRERVTTHRDLPAMTTVVIAPGLAVAAALGLVGVWLGKLVPVVGGPVFGLLLGVAVRATVGARDRWAPGTRFAASTVLKAAVVVLGAGLSIAQVVNTGWRSLPVMVGTIGVALIGASVVGRWLGIDRDTRTLIGVGTGICGASAIATVASVIRGSRTAIAVAMTTIFIFNVLAVLTFPTLGRIMGMSQASFGVWAGTAVNDTSSVVAAATIYGATATSVAVTVKLTRTLMIIPISLTHALTQRSRQTTDAVADTAERRSIRSLVPTFLVLFLAAAALNSVGLVPDGTHRQIGWIATFLITVALTGIGLGTPVQAVRKSGLRPLALGGVLWALVALSSLGLQALTMGT